MPVIVKITEDSIKNMKLYHACLQFFQQNYQYFFTKYLAE
jgi:hypothetical protein